MTEVPGFPGPIPTHSETMSRPSPSSPNSHNDQNHYHTNFDEKEGDSLRSTMEDFEKDDPRLSAGTGAGPNSDEESDNNGDLEKQAVRDDRNQEQGREKDANLVEWNGPNDPENPMNWSRGRKWMITLAMGSMTWVITFASSVFSTATVVTAHEFHTSEEVMILGTSLFVLVRLRITWAALGRPKRT